MANDIAKERLDPETGELTTTMEDTTPLAVQLASAELNQAITTARAFPRSISRAVNNIIELATLDDQTAAECVYALPRGGKPILGPSVRFAEIVASQWGNCDTASRTVDIDRFNKMVISEGLFHDLETGYRRVARISRRIVDSKGRLFNDDMIMVTSNAAASIAFRTAVLNSVPKGVWRRGYDAAYGAKLGDIKTMAVTRGEIIAAFAAWGVKPEQIFSAIDVGGLDDVGADQIALLRAMFRQIKDKEQTVEDFFPAMSTEEGRTTAAKGTAGKLADIAAEGADAKAAKAGKKADAPKPAQPAATPKEDVTKAAEPEKADDKAGDASTAEADGAAETSEDADDEGGSDLLGDQRPHFSDDDLEAAFQRGVAARAKGMARKATPTEWRDEAKAPLLDAYLRGFDGE